MTKRTRKTLNTSLKYLAALTACAFFGFPILWTFITAIKPVDLIPQVPPVWLFEPTLEHFRTIFAEKGLLKSLVNSLIVASASTVLALLVGVPAAYAFARFRFRGKEPLAFFFLSARMTPGIAVILPFFLIARDVGLLDTRFILILSYLTFNFGFVIWLLRGFFAEVPAEIDEAALVDGCSRFGAFWRVVLPMAAPGIAASAIICFIFAWNEFLFALVLTSISAKTLPVTAAGFVTDRLVLWGNLCATAVVIFVPVMIFAILTRRHLIRGMTMGAVK
ncbi:MAG: carbohydrate ABC transporter permease [Parvibaculaceae bacterium]